MSVLKLNGREVAYGSGAVSFENSTFTSVGGMYWLNKAIKDSQTINSTYLTKNSADNFTVVEGFNALIIGTFHVAQTTTPYITLKINGTQLMKVQAKGTSNRVYSNVQCIKLNAGDVIAGSITAESSAANNSSGWFGIYKID